MKYLVLEPFAVKTSQVKKELQTGQLITLSTDKALKLLNEGKITPAEKVTYKVYSEPLQAFLWVVETDQDMHSLRTQGISEAVYTWQDIKELRKLPKEHLKAIHEVKEVLPLSSIEEITTEKGDRH